MEPIKEFFEVFIPIFVAIDPFALLPIFVVYTKGFTPQALKRTIRQSVGVALCVSLSFMFIGEGIFRLLGITINDFKVAGGLVLLVIAILDLVNSSETRKRLRGATTVGVVPIGVPMIVGPALLTTLIILMDHFGLWISLSGLLTNLLLVWVLLRLSQWVVSRVGKEVILALSKLMSILLASIAVMMIRLGIAGLLKAAAQ